MKAFERALLVLLLAVTAACDEIHPPTNPSESMVPPGTRPPTLEGAPGAATPDAGRRDAEPAMGPETPI
jgi:hypothetical protein